MYDKIIIRTVMFIIMSISLSLTTNVLANTDTSHFSIDLGYVDISPDDRSGEVSGPGLPPQNSVDIKSASTIGMSLNYYQNKNISYQVYIAPPVELDVHASGSLTGMGQIATMEVLMPTAFVNYTFDQFEDIKPYVGVGINYAIFSNEKSNDVLNGTLGEATDLKLDNSFGLALQAGVRLDINDKWYVNANYLWADVDSTASIDTQAVGTKRNVDLEIDPSIIYISVGYRF